MTPCMKLATSEPPLKLRFQIQRDCCDLLRNSKATPRKIKPSSMKMTGI